MSAHGQTKLGFFPLPSAEAKRLKGWLNFPEQFSALDPCVGDGVGLSGGTGESLGDRDPAGECDGREVPGGNSVIALPESSVRLGSGRTQ
jgi:hypothetical protein